MRIFRGDLRDFEGLLHHAPQSLVREIAGIGRSRALSEQDPDARRRRAGFGQALDLAQPDVDREFVAFRDRALRAGCAKITGDGYGALGGTLQAFAHCAVPPTVILSILTVGTPTPTGTLCPSLPHTPMPSSSFRSFPTMLTYFSASGPLPISVAPRTGRVILPSSIR